MMSRWTEGSAADAWLERQRGMLVYWLPVAMAAGIGLYFSLNFEPPGAFGGVALALFLALTALAWPYRGGGWLALLYHAGWLTSFAAAGLCLAQIRTHAVASPMLDHAIRRAVVTGTVQSIDLLEAGRGLRLILGDMEIEGLPPERTPRFARIKIRAAPDVHLGERVRLTAGLNPPSGPVAPHAFDFQFYAWFRQIGAFGFAYGKVEDEGAGKGGVSLAERLRQGISDRVNRALTGSRAAMSIAMMTGEVSAVPQSDWEAMRDSGLAHMLALSGTHVGLIAGFVFFTLRGALALWPRAALYWPIKKIAAGAAMVAVTGFVWLIGPLLPVVRALVMTDIVLIGVMADRTAISLRLLAIATMVVMAFMPEALLGASFQMSYAAVGALILFFESTRAWWFGQYRAGGLVRKAALYILGLCATTIIAEAATAPFSLFHFQQFSSFGLLANLAAGSLMSFIVMPMVVAVFLALPFGLEAWPLRVMGWGVQRILDIAYGVAALPHATLHLRDWPVEALSMMVLGLFALLALRGRIRWTGAAMIACSALVIALYQPPDILAAGSGKLIGLRQPDGSYAVSNLSAERFSAENWMRAAGHDGEQPQRWPGEGRMGDLACDELGCRLQRQGRNIAFSFEEQGQGADCAWADIVIARTPLYARPCHAARIIDFYDLRREGAMAVWLDGRVESVAGVRGKRPWTVTNGR